MTQLMTEYQLSVGSLIGMDSFPIQEIDHNYRDRSLYLEERADGMMCALNV
jgi:hypothetical protein